MNHYEQWAENRPKIPPGEYQMICLKAEKKGIWHAGQGGWGRSEKVVLWLQVFDGEHAGVVLPMFLTVGENKKGKHKQTQNGAIHQGSKYFIFWCIANGLRKPPRCRLKEMSLSKFENKIFRIEVVDVKPKLNGHALADIFTYSRADYIYELIHGNPSA